MFSGAIYQLLSRQLKKNQKRQTNVTNRRYCNTENGLSWTEERKAKLRELHPTHSHAELAVALNTTKGAIDSIVTRLKLKKVKISSKVFQADTCRHGQCRERITDNSWPFCPDHMKAARKKHHV